MKRESPDEFSQRRGITIDKKEGQDIQETQVNCYNIPDRYLSEALNTEPLFIALRAHQVWVHLLGDVTFKRRHVVVVM
jgi:hypothetical protein